MWKAYAAGLTAGVLRQAGAGSIAGLSTVAVVTPIRPLRLISHMADHAASVVNPQRPAKRHAKLALGTIMLLVAIGYGTVQISGRARAMGWIGQQGYLTITDCAKVPQQRGGPIYTCSGNYFADNSEAGPTPVRLRGQPSDPFPMGKVLRVARRDAYTVDQVGFRGAVDTLSEMFFIVLGFGGMGLVSIGIGLIREEGWGRNRSGLMVFAVGVIGVVAGIVLGTLSIIVGWLALL